MAYVWCALPAVTKKTQKSRARNKENDILKVDTVMKDNRLNPPDQHHPTYNFSSPS
ncbi:MAG TPA: hypothetical protein VJ440_00630 [Candidatus Brocadiaceae bacterium]|nr:hypothetical protein [Candidatus Brocadiaceae bacterium]